MAEVRRLPPPSEGRCCEGSAAAASEHVSVAAAGATGVAWAPGEAGGTETERAALGSSLEVVSGRFVKVACAEIDCIEGNSVSVETAAEPRAGGAAVSSADGSTASLGRSRNAGGDAWTPLACEAGTAANDARGGGGEVLPT